jgi:L-threonylcarbamoyladenylate synthase
MSPPNPLFDTDVCSSDAAGIAKAAALIAQGLPVAVPTETVYGLAADATNGEAVARIYAAKGRPAFNPLIVHVETLAQAERIACFDDMARRLAAAFWPGPLTIVLPLAAGSPVAPLVTAGLGTVAVRMPSHPTMRALLAACGTPLAAPSANASGLTSPTRAAHVLRSLAGRIALVIDAGPTAVGLESTIVAIAPDGLRLLRPGPVTAAALAEASGLPVTTGSHGTITAPGQMASHYAPSKPLRLDAMEARDGEWLIGFGAIPGDVTLSATGDPIEAAARLFALLHDADRSDSAAIAVAPIPEDGIGAAINDRLRRAAAPR